MYLRNPAYTDARKDDSIPNSCKPEIESIIEFFECRAVKQLLNIRPTLRDCCL